MMEQVTKLSEGAFGKVFTVAMKARVFEAVKIEKSKLVLNFLYSEADESAFYATFLDRVIQYTENQETARKNAQYLKGQIASNKQAYTLAEIAFLCKTILEPVWTAPLELTFAAWENIARVNPANLPIVVEQMLQNTPASDNPNPSGGNTGGANTPTPQPADTAVKSLTWSVLGGVIVYFITRLFPKKL